MFSCLLSKLTSLINQGEFIPSACQLMNVSDYKVWKLLDIYVDEARFNQDLSNIDTFGLDETSVAKGHDYITLFVDLYFK
jgi:hypothetical protein